MIAKNQNNAAKQTTTVPVFDLYGEDARYTDPGFVHIETIADRSSSNGWVIRPHRHGNMLQLLCLYAGRYDVKIDDAHYVREGPCAMVVPPGAIHGFAFSPDTQGMVLTIALPMLSSPALAASRACIDDLCEHKAPIDLANHLALFRQLEDALEMIRREIASPAPGRTAMLEWLSGMTLMLLWRGLDADRSERAPIDQPGRVLQRFRELLEERFESQWQVDDYATALHVSVSTLARHCRQLTGCTPKALIHNRVLLAAKRRLMYTQESIGRIAEGLGFQDASYFSRFFRKQTGMSPKQFREEQQGRL